MCGVIFVRAMPVLAIIYATLPPACASAVKRKYLMRT